MACSLCSQLLAGAPFQMRLCSGATARLTFLTLHTAPLALEQALPRRKAPQPRSHLVLGFSSTSSWPALTSLTAEPTQVITVPAHQTQFSRAQLDTFLGHRPTEKVATKPARCALGTLRHNLAFRELTDVTSHRVQKHIAEKIRVLIPCA